MPIATLTFTLPEESGAFDRAANGAEAFAVLSEIDELLRGILKHGSAREPQSVYEEIRERCGNALWLVGDV